MADPKSTLPYTDPYESPEEILNLMDFRNPTLADLKIHERFPSQSVETISDDTIVELSDPFDDPALWGGPGDHPDARNSQASEGGTWTAENSMRISGWPSEPVPFACSCCQVLREIIHTNGNEITKLDIHGRLGIISHAILDVHSPNLATAGHQYRIFDFCKKSIDGVKQFLIKYCLERTRAGFWMIPDPLSTFFEALCVGVFWDESRNVTDDPAQPVNPNAENEQDGMSSSMKTSLAAQRERTLKLTIKDIGDYFHLPIEEAAKKMKLCPTVVKKICRRDGLARWPHRKIKAMERQISNWTAILETSTDPNELVRAQTKIQRLQQELAKIRETGI